MENKTILNISKRYNNNQLCINSELYVFTIRATDLIHFILRKRGVNYIEVSNHTFTDGDVGDYGVVSKTSTPTGAAVVGDGITLYHLDWLTGNHPYGGTYITLCNKDLLKFFNHIPPNIYIKA